MDICICRRWAIDSAAEHGCQCSLSVQLDARGPCTATKGPYYPTIGIGKTIDGINAHLYLCICNIDFSNVKLYIVDTHSVELSYTVERSANCLKFLNTVNGCDSELRDKSLSCTTTINSALFAFGIRADGVRYHKSSTIRLIETVSKLHVKRGFCRT